MFAQGNGFQILSLGANGRLTWTNSYPNGLYGVEWASCLTGPWQDNWTALKSLIVTGQTAAVDVPMFYRVKCDTNLLMPMPMGAYLEMSVSNAARPGLDRTHDRRRQRFPALQGEGVHRARGHQFPIPGCQQTMLMRSTSNALYGVEADCGMERSDDQYRPSAPPGRTIVCGEVTVNTIEAIELVTVPLGTFTCLRVRKQQLNTSHPNPVWIEWWQPGFGQVQWVDYYVESGEYPPVMHRLTARGLAQ